MRPVFTIITVCWNAEDEIAETVTSVINQECEDYEYLIVDGKSSDSTLSIIDKMVCDVKDKIRIISEKDNGIYDAMNKGIELAQGEWLLFLNAGDKLHDSKVLSRAIEYIRKSIDIDFIYGDALYVYEKTKNVIKAKSIESIVTGMPFCHQCVFNNRLSIRALMYNDKYKICADYEMYLRAYEKKCKFDCIDLIISDYKVGGFSEKNQFRLVDEKYEIQKSHNINHHTRVSITLYKVKIKLSRIIRKLLPEEFSMFIRKVIHR